MKIGRGTKPYHRRNWRRLWRYCRCGLRWRCPDSVDLVPMPYAPVVPPAPGRLRAYNRRSGWDASTRPYLENSRVGALRPARAARIRDGERV
ncbi:hypothetical protein Pen02_09850 [Plantactinospora endophytica]|uniref:Uncharacterized protein n=1 Tax=Plantactinospora endophytica TaxID=673535 RepID=A0ABQ4DUA7_9ACTN|nr:hypothetical protein Pen02_09850 [Plantactinospora endophytica]